MKIKNLLIVLGVCAGVFGVQAAAIPEADIRATAIGYIACQGGRLLDGSVGGRAIDRMYPITEEIDGAMVTLAYGVAFEPEGWVIVTADDRFDPVLGFSAEGRFRPEILADRSSAPYAFIVRPLAETYRQLQARAKQPVAIAAGAAGQAADPIDGLVASAQARRNRYLDRGEQLEGKRPLMIEAFDPLKSVSDPRVDKLLATAWAQHDHGEEYYLEQYYCHGAVSGCNQTMIGQIMYYHKWPQAGIGKIHNYQGKIYRREGGEDTRIVNYSGNTYKITLFYGLDDPQNPVKTEYEDVWCRGGDGEGGPYQWDKMYVSGSSSSTSQQEALGALMFDLGVASGAKYTVTKTQLGQSEVEVRSTSATTWPEVMMNVFDYANVRATPIGQYGSSGITGELVPGGGAALTNSLHCNLDAKLPCMLNVLGLTSMSGHGVIADGYGFQDSTPYYHINFGYAGDHDGYYQWNAMYTYGMAWAYFNIYPQATGEIVSGRVLKPNGDPLAGATVTVSCSATNVVCTSDARGIWAAVGVPSNASVTVTPSASGYSFTARNVTVGKSSQTYCQPVQADCGNVWGVDFTGEEKIPETVTLSAASAAVATNADSATLSVTVSDCTVKGGTLTLYLNDVKAESWTLANGVFSKPVAVTPGSNNTFEFVAEGGGLAESVSSRGAFAAVVYEGWFDVKFGDSGFVAGEDWLAGSVEKSGGTFAASAGATSVLVKGERSYVDMTGSETGEIAYTPSHASKKGADVVLDGSAQVTGVASVPELPAGSKTAVCFVGGKVKVYANGSWTELAGAAVTEGEWVDYRLEFDYSSASAPRVRYTVKGVTGEWLAIAAADLKVNGLAFAGGVFSDFKAECMVISGPDPIELVKPEFTTDGSALSLTDTTFSMTIANPVKGAYYTVFTSTSLTGTFTAEKSVPFDSDAATFALEIDADTPTKFAKIVISLEAFEIGAPLP